MIGEYRLVHMNDGREMQLRPEQAQMVIVLAETMGQGEPCEGRLVAEVPLSRAVVLKLADHLLLGKEAV